ncbi:MAG: hypothetical protein S4CHLAM7_07000 [Chlamydiae bacterium]|nr:hypothetical protein [Chlamydiota bacterium]
MDKTQIQISEWGLVFGFALLVLTIFLQWRFRKRDNTPAVLYSNLNAMESFSNSWRVKFILVPSFFKKGAFLLFLIALCNPIFLVPSKKDQKKPTSKKEEPNLSKKLEEEVNFPTEGIAIYFVLDQSGSMQAEMGPMEGVSKNKPLTRLDALKFLTTQFIMGNEKLELKGRKEDLIGLVAFARVPRILAPLTLDHELVEKELSKLSTLKHQVEEGTAIGYAIYKTAHLIAATEHFCNEIKGEDKPAYDIKSTIMILVTDGFQNPSNLDRDHPLRNMGVEAASAFAEEKGIRLYIVNVEPALGHPQYNTEREELRKSAERTGGQFFLVSNAYHLQKIYRVIDRIEKSKQVDPQKRHIFVEEKNRTYDG